MKTLSFAIRVILGIAVTYAVQRLDRRRLDSWQLDRAWNGASWGSALYGFGPLSMLGWVWVTRAQFSQWARRNVALALAKCAALLLAGLLVAVAISLVVEGAVALIGWLAGA